jgi:predicted amidophosphoribosyltransferase
MLLLDKINFLRREHLLQIEYERRHRRPPVSVGCKACREENPVENTYCDNCGYPLDPRGHYVH